MRYPGRVNGEVRQQRQSSCNSGRGRKDTARAPHLAPPRVLVFLLIFGAELVP